MGVFRRNRGAGPAGSTGREAAEPDSRFSSSGTPAGFCGFGRPPKRWRDRFNGRKAAAAFWAELRGRSAKGPERVTHHLAAGVLRQAGHHGVHLLELLEGRLHLRVELLVLGILVVEHGPVLVPLLVRPDRRVLPVGGGGTGEERLEPERTSQLVSSCSSTPNTDNQTKPEGRPLTFGPGSHEDWSAF